MAQGTQVTGNLLYNNTTDDIFVEVNHGPFLIENNILLSELSIRDWSEGGAFVHNLIAGNMELRPQSRETPFQLPHSTEVGGLKTTQCGDNRYFNNIFVGGVAEINNQKSGLGVYNEANLPMFVNGNVYLNGATRFEIESNPLEIAYNPEVKIERTDEGVFLTMDIDKKLKKMKNQVVTTELLGEALIPGQGYVNPDDSPITIDIDYLGNARNRRNPTVGPLENPGQGKQTFKVWSTKN